MGHAVQRTSAVLQLASSFWAIDIRKGNETAQSATARMWSMRDLSWIDSRTKA